VSISSLNTYLYFVCQALAASTSGILVTESAMAGAELAGDPMLATLPVALQHLATLCANLPASQLMARVGRRAGFTLGAIFGMVGSAVATLALVRGSFALLCAGCTLVGGYLGFTSFYRFAAAEGAAAGARERALAWVMSAGVLAAFLGPWLARSTVHAWSARFAGSYALLFSLALVAALVLQLLRSPPEGSAPPARPPDRDVAGPTYRTAIAVGMVATAAMVFVMTATPLAMTACHHGFAETTYVIQWHVVAMYAPSFFTGRLVARFGASRIMVVGLLLCALSAAANMSGTSVAFFQLGLFLLGLGWNFAYVGMSATLAAAPPERRAGVQGLGELLVSVAVAAASLLAGIAQHGAGWQAVNLFILPPVALVTLAVQLGERRHEGGSDRRR